MAGQRTGEIAIARTDIDSVSLRIWLKYNDEINRRDTRYSWPYEARARGAFGVGRIGIYGSYAHGTQTEISDIDLIVELKEPRFDDLAGLYIYMEQVLGRNVDIRRYSKKIDTPFMRRIEREALFV